MQFLTSSCYYFQALQYLLKLCSHPLLVLGQRPPESLMRLLSEVMPSCSDIISALHELEHSPKLVALKEILEECGIGQDATGIEGGGTAAGEHRVLIFAQHRVTEKETSFSLYPVLGADCDDPNRFFFLFFSWC